MGTAAEPTPPGRHVRHCQGAAQRGAGRRAPAGGAARRGAGGREVCASLANECKNVVSAVFDHVPTLLGAFDLHKALRPLPEALHAAMCDAYHAHHRRDPDAAAAGICPDHTHVPAALGAGFERGAVRTVLARDAKLGRRR
jgi:hypothetical protein